MTNVKGQNKGQNKGQSVIGNNSHAGKVRKTGKKGRKKPGKAKINSTFSGFLWQGMKASKGPKIIS